ncbi:MAG: CIA30 family protein [candidate division Zixibacteria bacterium]|nr:CIA30 family protein [candidate division Zixibacteria bacterium]
MSEKENTSRILFEFVDSSEAGRWMAVNDDVMGGVSKGWASPTEDSCLLFSGSISLENNGGFASFRSQPTDFNLGGYRGIRIRVKGDGRIYQFRLRTDRNLDGVAYKHEFETVDNTWIELDLPFASFVATYRGRTLPDFKPVEAGDIKQLGFLLADKEAGPFSLKVDKIAAFK